MSTNAPAVSRAENHKARGNIFYAQQLYEDAIKEYTTAIIINPTETTYYTNRAMAHLKLCQYDRAISDAEKARELNPDSLKAYYILGISLSESSDRLDNAITYTQKAYSLAISQNSPSTTINEIIQLLFRIRKQKWIVSHPQRSELHSFLIKLIEDSRSRSIDNKPQKQQKDIHRVHDEKLLQLEKLFQEQMVPDAFIGKLNFEIMVDPVITKSGITYDRRELLDHFAKLGYFDPITREQLSEKDLIPNLALKEVIEEWTGRNGWAVDA